MAILKIKPRFCCHSCCIFSVTSVPFWISFTSSSFFKGSMDISFHLAYINRIGSRISLETLSIYFLSGWNHGIIVMCVHGFQPCTAAPGESCRFPLGLLFSIAAYKTLLHRSDKLLRFLPALPRLCLCDILLSVIQMNYYKKPLHDSRNLSSIYFWAFLLNIFCFV